MYKIAYFYYLIKLVNYWGDRLDTTYVKDYGSVTRYTKFIFKVNLFKEIVTTIPTGHNNLFVSTDYYPDKTLHTTLVKTLGITESQNDILPCKVSTQITYGESHGYRFNIVE